MSLVPEAIEYHIPHVATPLLMSWLAWFFIAAFSIAASRNRRMVPKGVQNVCELCFEMIFQLADDSIGKRAGEFYPLFIGVFIYIMISNMMGLIPGLISPTSDLNITVSLALIVFFYYNFQGFRKKGWHYLEHFFGPKLPWYMFPVSLLMFVIEIIGNFARPFSLALRLFCNIFSKEILLGLLAVILVKFIMGPTIIEKGLAVAPLLLRPFIILLGLMIGLIQALIFLVLSIAYVAGAVQTEEH
jgi:F-type H+-transporting ATPase subunit a